MAYHYNVRRSHRLRPVLIVVCISVLLVGAIGLIGWWELIRTPDKATVVQGNGTYIPQAATAPSVYKVTASTFTMELPGDWKQTGEENAPTQHSISWQATAKNQDNRYLTLYIDTIPAAQAVNRELPLVAHGQLLTYGPVSDNCSNFTTGGTTNVAQAVKLKPTPSVWQGVNFICDLPNVVDNKVGTGSMAGVNTVTIAGPKSGTHSYFFLYTDHNIQPDYTILLNALESFRAT